MTECNKDTILFCTNNNYIKLFKNYRQIYYYNNRHSLNHHGMEMTDIENNIDGSGYGDNAAYNSFLQYIY
jgi:hypothetical protein